jgi:hypothetical protein
LPLSSTKRAWLAAGVLVMLAAAAVTACLHFARRSASTAASKAAGPPIYSASPQQIRYTVEVIDELPGDAPGVAYIDVETLRKLQASPLAEILGLRGDPGPEDAEYRKFVRETGFDYTRDLDRAAIAVWFDGLGDSIGAASADSRACAIADGRFNEGKIRAYALKSGRLRVSGSRIVYEIPGKPFVSFEFLSPARIAIASGTRSTELLARRRQTTRDPAFQARIDRVVGAPLFAVLRADALPDSFYANFKSSPQIDSLARTLRTLTLAAQSQRDTLKIVLDGESTSAKDALAISTLLEISRMGASMALPDSKTSAQMSPVQATFMDALVRRSRISHQDRWVRLDFDITPEMLGAGDAASPAGKSGTVDRDTQKH